VYELKHVRITFIFIRAPEVRWNKFLSVYYQLYGRHVILSLIAATFLCSLMLSVGNTAAANSKLLTAGHGFAMSQKVCANLPWIIYLSLNNLHLVIGELKTSMSQRNKKWLGDSTPYSVQSTAHILNFYNTSWNKKYLN
jgi:hypothetical protein